MTIYSLLDHGTMIIAFGWIAYANTDFYKNPNYKKREWLAGLSCLLILYHVVMLVIDLGKERPPAPAPVVAEKPLTPEEATALFKTDAKSAIEEQPILIPNGPIITLPAGYQYVLPSKGSTRLIATGKNKGTVVLLQIDQYQDLRTLEKSIRAETKPESGHSLGPANPEVINGCDSFVMTISNPKKDFTGHVLLTSNGRVAYYLMIGSPKALEKAVQAEHFRILHSFVATVR